jgi:hypothetical protein
MIEASKKVEIEFFCCCCGEIFTGDGCTEECPECESYFLVNSRSGHIPQMIAWMQKIETQKQTQMQKMEAQVGALMRANIEKDGIIQGLMFAIEKPEQAKERNPEACCGNCAYFDGDEKVCKRQSKKVFQHIEGRDCYPSVNADSWCGDHPDFWRVKQEKGTVEEQVKEASTRG